MQGIYPDIQRLGGEVLAISFTEPSKIAYFLDKYPIPFPVLADPSRAGYQAFALGKTSIAAMMRPGVIWDYLRLIFRGWLPRMPAKNDDLLQLGGDFVLDRAGRVRFVHESKDATDRPTTTQLLEALRQAGETWNV